MFPFPLHRVQFQQQLSLEICIGPSPVFPREDVSCSAEDPPHGHIFGRKGGLVPYEHLVHQYAIV